MPPALSRSSFLLPSCPHYTTLPRAASRAARGARKRRMRGGARAVSPCADGGQEGIQAVIAREAACGALLRPVALCLRHGHTRQRCARCGRAVAAERATQPRRDHAAAPLPEEHRCASALGAGRHLLRMMYRIHGYRIITFTCSSATTASASSCATQGFTAKYRLLSRASRAVNTSCTP